MVTDLYEISDHAGRKSIDPGDVSFLFKRYKYLSQMNSFRQRLAKDEQGITDLIRQHLPLELVEEIIPVARENNSLVPSSSFLSRRTRSKTTKKSVSSNDHSQEG